MRDEFFNLDRKSDSKTSKLDGRKALSVCEWLVVGVALGFVLTAVAVAMYIHRFAT